MASSTYQQRVYRNDDRSAMVDKIHRARLHIARLENECAGAEDQIRAAQSRADSIPPYDRGWPIEMIGVLACVAVVLEWYPARMMSLVFFFASAVELVALTAAFAVGGFLLGLLLGELLRRHRRPQVHAALDWVFLGAAVVAVGAFLAVGYELRLAYAQASSDAAQSPVPPVIQAAALTTLAFIGIVIAFTSGYYRESVEAMRLRWRLGRLHREVRRNERHLEAMRAELDAVERASGLADQAGGAAAREQTGGANWRYGEIPASGSSGGAASGGSASCASVNGAAGGASSGLGGTT